MTAEDRIDRRQFLVGVAATGALAGTIRRGTGSPARFDHGVASGDPGPDRVVLWSRVSGTERAVDVSYAVYEDPDGARVVTAGTARAGPEADHTVRVEVGGLRPGTTYWYRFGAGPDMSPLGRTRTLPAGGIADVRLGVVSCARYPSGFYPAYAALADEDVDAVLHLGDYIYEDGRGGLRPHVPDRETGTLDDYRTRYAQYRTDPDLQRLHASHPVIAIWDDHEFADNCWRDGARNREQGWPDRRAAAAQAWREWLPAQAPDPSEPLRIWRSFAFGDLLSLSCLDTRVWGRDRQGTSADEIDDPDRSLLGADQLEWLTDQLGSDVPWRVVANQVMMAPLSIPRLGGAIDGVLSERGLVFRGDAAVNPDQWDGYQAERARVLGAAAGSTVVLTGDLHSSWASEIAGPSGSRVAVEFVGPSVSSSSFGATFGTLAETAGAFLRQANAGLRHVDLVRHGYMVARFGPDSATVTYRLVNPTNQQDRSVATGAVLEVDRAEMSIATRTAADIPPDRPLPTIANEADAGSGSDPASGGGGDDGGVPGLALPAAIVAASAGVGTAIVAGARRRGSRPDGHRNEP